MVDINAVAQNYIMYVFGDVILAMIGFLIIITLIGMRFGWGLEAFTVVLTPTIILMVDSYIPIGLEPLMLMGIGFIIGFGMLAILRR